MTAIRRFNGGNVVALCGGIGGAKLALGLTHCVPAGKLTIIVNTGDDFEHLGLRICPDLDTTMYTLAGVANPATGWGYANDTWAFMRALERQGGETWFRIGDYDLAIHAERTNLLERGARLTDVTHSLAAKFGIETRLLPATDDPLSTVVETDEGRLAFQHYFVREQYRPRVRGIAYAGSDTARPTPEVESALRSDDLDCVVICPSNPYLSIEPILAIPGVRDLLRGCRAPIAAVSPIVGGQSIKGPLSKIMSEFGTEPTPWSIAAMYADFLDLFVFDQMDADKHTDQDAFSIRTLATRTIMTSLEDRISLARFVLAACHGVRSRA